MDAQVMIPAFLMGLAGSLHCVGMCGPIAMSLPLSSKGPAGKVTGSLLYSLGRITTYSVFGAVFGLVGRSIAWFGWQQKISILLGVAILTFLVFPVLFPRKSLHPLISQYMTRVRTTLAKTIFRSTPSALFTTGLLNGLLPCGLVYMAVTGAAIAGDPLPGALFMAMFGLGTLPAMFATSLFGQWIKPSARIKMRQIYPALMVVMAMLLILRGLNLGIPLVSPKINTSNAETVECHTR